MVRDRLQELQQQQAIPPMPHPSLSPALAELSVHSLQFPSTSAAGDPFLDHIAQMGQSVEEIDRRVRTMVEVQETILGQTVVRPEDKEHLDLLIGEIHQRTGGLHANFRQLERDMETEGRTPADARQRIRRNQSEQLRRRLNEVLEVFNSALEEYRQRVNRRVRRQLELVGEQLSTSEVDQLLEDKSEEIFFRRLAPISFAAQMALEDASSRHSELLRLERSIGELSDCFRDMLQLVHAQGALVDNIESNVQSAGEFVVHAREQMHHAVIHKKSAQRLKCAVVLGLGLLMLVLLLALVILLAKFLPSGGSR